ncbi:unknown [Firmicutes bacterium CAG:170]|nr:unknown [Firmicutes bacterium CAG:170]
MQPPLRHQDLRRRDRRGAHDPDILSLKRDRRGRENHRRQEIPDHERRNGRQRVCAQPHGLHDPEHPSASEDQERSRSRAEHDAEARVHHIRRARGKARRLPAYQRRPCAGRFQLAFLIFFLCRAALHGHDADEAARQERIDQHERSEQERKRPQQRGDIAADHRLAQPDQRRNAAQRICDLCAAGRQLRHILVRTSDHDKIRAEKQQREQHRHQILITHPARQQRQQPRKQARHCQREQIQHRKQQQKCDHARRRRIPADAPRRQRRDGHDELEHGVVDRQRDHPGAEDVPRRHRHGQQKLVVLRLKKLRFGHKDAADEHERKGHQRVKREIQPREVRSAEGSGQCGEQREEHTDEYDEAVDHQQPIQYLRAGTALFLLSAAPSGGSGIIRAEGGQARFQQRLKHCLRPPAPGTRPPATGRP